MIKLEHLTENQIKHLKDLSSYCYTNESDFRVTISLRLVSRIQDKALNTHWDCKESVADYKEYATKLIKLWFPYLSDTRVAEEVQNIKTKSTININVIVRDMMQLYKQFN